MVNYERTFSSSGYKVTGYPINGYYRMVGLTGRAVEFSYFREGSFVVATRYLNYSGSAIWFAPIPLADWGGMAQIFRELTLTRTKITSLIKVELLIFPLLLVCSILFCSFLWKLNPIPSAAYPFAAKMWPVRSYFACLWASATRTGDSFLLEAINGYYVLAGFGFGAVLFGVFMIMAFVAGILPKMVPFAFLTGGFFSGLCGFLGMKTATAASARTAQGAKESLNRGLQVAFRSGAVMGLVVVGFGLLNIAIWYLAMVGIFRYNLWGMGQSLAVRHGFLSAGESWGPSVDTFALNAVTPRLHAFRLEAGAEQIFPFAVQGDMKGLWAVAKVMWYGRLQYVQESEPA